TLHGGALDGLAAQVVVGPRAVPHLWAQTDKLVVTVSGDLTRDELIAVAEALAPAGAPAAKACSPANLRTSVFAEGATGAPAIGVRLENGGDVPCTLAGRPDAALERADGTA